MSEKSNLTTLMAAAEDKPDSTPALDVVKLIIPDVSWTGTVGSDSHIKFKHHHPERRAHYFGFQIGECSQNVVKKHCITFFVHRGFGFKRPCTAGSLPPGSGVIFSYAPPCFNRRFFKQRATFSMNVPVVFCRTK